MCPGSPLVGNSSVESAGNFGSRPSGRGGRLWRSRHIPPLLKTFAAAARFKNAALARLAAGTRPRNSAAVGGGRFAFSTAGPKNKVFGFYYTISVLEQEAVCVGGLGFRPFREPYGQILTIKTENCTIANSEFFSLQNCLAYFTTFLLAKNTSVGLRRTLF